MTYTAPTSITIQASAFDSDGTVSKVDFYQGCVLLGTDTTIPYEVAWNNVGAGNYSLTARATDNRGAATTSDAVNITVDADPDATPGIVDGATLRLAGTHTFTATPSNSGGTITWTVDREVTSESGGNPSLTRNVLSATGATASFNLTKVSGRETVYYVRAQDNGFNDTQTVQVFPPNVRSSFTYKSAGNPNVRTYIVVPSTLSASTHIVMVMHGNGRNADEYINTWVGWASQNNYIALAPRFDDSSWPGSRSYHSGNIFTGDDGAGTKNPEAKWSFTVVEGIHQRVQSGFAVNDTLFDLWGHSAGGQFVHRFMLFKPNAKVRFAMPANSGWYTAPDLNIDYPYGVRHPQLSLTMQDLVDCTNKQMIIFRGTADTLRDSDLRTTPEADAQGLNRYQRALYMYNKGVNLNSNLNWQLLDVPNADHDQIKMAPAAQDFLRNPNPPLPHQ